MLMIRFQRIGRKNDPAFRIAVLEKTAGPKAGSYVDLVGTYNPKTKAVTLQPDRIKDWVSKGAQVSPTAMNLFIKQGVFEGKPVQVISKKNLEKNIAKKAAEDAAAAAKAAEEAAKAEAAAAKAAEEAAAAPAEEAPAETPAEVEPAPADVPEAAPEEAPAPEVTAEETADAEVAA
jgi:small subunit ribosomal protein S16